MNNVIPDLQQRTEALDPSTSFIVQAPAGSGKTELLTQRFLNLLSKVKHPEEIIAITFTKKAVMEMQARIIQALQCGLQATPPEEAHAKTTWLLAQAALQRDAEQSWQLLDNPARLRILTIDSFCSRLTKQLPITSELGAQSTIAEDSNPLYQQAAQLTLDEIHHTSGPQKAVNILLSHLDNHYGRAEGLLIKMLSKRDQWLPLLSQCHQHNDELRQALESQLAQCHLQCIQDLDQALSGELKQTLYELLHFASHCLESNSFLAPWQTLNEFPEPDIGHREQWQCLVTFLLTKNASFRKQATAAIGFPAPSTCKNPEEKSLFATMKARYKELLEVLTDQADLLNHLSALKNAPNIEYTDAQWELLSALMTLLPYACAHLKVIFSQRGEMDYVENSLAALTSLGSFDAPTDLALMLDYSLQHILVDEFQDTSINQFQLLEKLTAGWQPGDGKSLFIVGDPMQSIYRFRQAEVGLFLHAKHHGINNVELIPLSLSSNFRSCPHLINWVNKAFNDIFPHQENASFGAIPYAASSAIKKDSPEATVQAHILTDPETTQPLIDRIQHQQQHFPSQSIALLVRSRDHVSDIIPALQHARIPYQAIEIERLNHRPIIYDLFSLTRALLHLHDKTAWLAVLRAPWLGLSLTDLHTITQGEHPSLLAAIQDETLLLTDHAKNCLPHVAKVLKASLEQRQRLPLRDWIEVTWLQLGGAECLASLDDFDNAHAYFDLLENLDHTHVLPNLSPLEQRLNSLFAATPPLKNPAAVQIMTIHKSKGLEFDCVFIPELQRCTRANEKALLLWQSFPSEESVDNIILAPIEPQNTHESIYRHIAQRETKKLQLESARLLYVACTRAKQQLHLFAHLAVDEEEALIPPRPQSFLGILWDSLQSRIKRYDDVKLPANDALGSLYRLTKPATPLTQTPAYAIGRDNHPSLSKTGETLTSLQGSALHFALEQISYHSLKWGEALSKNIVGLNKICQKFLILPENINESCAWMASALQATLSDDKGRWILSSHQEAQSELAISTLTDNKPETLILDRTFVDEENVRWIIDYKSSVPQEENLDAFLSRMKITYAPQLNRYAKAMAEMDGRPIKTALYFPVLGHLEVCQSHAKQAIQL